ncbi:unnamed protein product [Candidula unifasciata]|uniref:E3 SUMO-protein ligase PIAS2 n=1 Tax=Candidula unifasciata TaxID=100452 RepID=A0A8S3ZA42_9EUPU|nr:unnamed protein product [Candidula unifasciata]
MADLAELKQMVLSFRVSELHVLLGFAGRNKSGRKQELTQRALALVQKGCSLQVQIKVRELYRQIYPVGKAQNSSPVHQEDINMPLMQRHPGGLDYSTLNIRPVLSQAGKRDVRLKHLPFYDVLAEILKPSSLVAKNNGRMQETLFVFHLTPQQAQDITMSRDFRPGAKCEYTVQVQLRFCLLEPSCEQADIFPSQIQVRVNNKPATLPNVIPTNKPNVEPKRPGRPVDITSLCRLSPTVSNAITVTWAADFTRSFCMSIYLVRKLSSEILLARLKQFGHRHLDHTRALITEKLAQDSDSDIATTSLRVSLMCPLGKMRMQMPCRASTCTHLQCFDASTFLMMNERKPTWMCPVCDRPCPYDKLIIDGYFVNIFQQSPACNDIMFHEDGSWSPIKPQKENANQVILTTTSKPLVSTAPSPLIISSSLKSVPLSTSTSLPVLSQPTTAAPVQKPASTKGPVIDLTLDSSDEDDDNDIPGEPVSSSLAINLDTPSPVSVTNVPASPTRGPASPTTGPALPTSGPDLPATGPTSPAVGPANSILPPSTMTFISQPSSIVTASTQPPPSLFQSSPSHHGAKSQDPSHRDIPSSTVDSTLQPLPSTTQTSFIIIII